MSEGQRLAGLSGMELGRRTVSYDDRDTILYNLAVGATATELDLVYERNLRALPTYACALGLWAVEAAGRLGAYDPLRSLHGSQRLEMHEELPPGGDVSMTARIANVYDKGAASLLEVEVSSTHFTAVYQIFLPGTGGWGGERGPSGRTSEPVEPDRVMTYQTSPRLAALYRLTGDRHPVHIDPEQARSSGFERPILHGLCTVGIVARLAADRVGAHPSDLRSLEVRLTAPVLPGEVIDVACGERDGVVHLEARVADTVVLSHGRATYDGSSFRPS